MNKFLFILLAACAAFPTWPINAVERSQQAIDFVQDKKDSLQEVVAASVQR